VFSVEGPKMKHAGSVCLEELNALLSEVRGLGVLVEKKPGIFYSKGRAYLHFHEDPAGVFADARVDGSEFTRYAVNSEVEKKKFMEVLRAALRP
jgi:hypothetical protein